jgi:2-keto-4-pentenoate hydratase/2-oxohepta-3-ene-1,7-dioic acid hydratase in catechol pathway
MTALTFPSKIVCIGRNYRAHAEELGNEVPTSPMIFLKPPSAIIGVGERIVLPPQSQQVEFEGEIGVVIGARARNVEESGAAAVVSGICAINDVTARDLQRTDGQWTRAKGFDTFCPIGPTHDYRGDFAALTVVTRVNGTERQRSSADLMVFAIPRLIAFISSVMTLEPGDVIATGTPAGVGRLHPGDVVEVDIVGGPTPLRPEGTGLSRVTNPVV